MNAVTGSEPSSQLVPARTGWRRAWRQMREMSLAEPATLVGLAILVGIIGGLGAVVFRWLISEVRILVIGIALGKTVGWSAPLVPYLRILGPAIGLVLVGVITTYFAREVKGHGVPQILEAIALRGGRIRPRVAFFGILAPAITIGAEGSVGREGPIALIGAAFGSTLGQVMRLAEQQITLLVACGAAAGIGATFNAPVAGALFGLEVVLGSYAMGALVPCFVSSVVAVTIFRWIEGSQPILPTPVYTFAHPFGVLFMIPLGIIAGLVGLAYTRGLTFVESLNEELPGGFATKAIIGGLLVGGIGFFVPQILGVGYAPMQAVAGARITGILILLLLLVGKYVATLLTIGSGGSGGVFAPSLFLGVSLGAVYGSIVHNWLPQLTGPAALYAVGGMGAVFAAAAQAPLTAATIILEMTGDYSLATGVMLACAISFIFYGAFARDSMYTVRLRRRGIQILRGTEVQPLNHVPISAAIDSSPVTLLATTSIDQAARALTDSGARNAVVLDGAGELVGILDGARVFETVGKSGAQPDVGAMARRDVPVLTPNASLDDAMRRFGVHGITILPVVTELRSRRLVGVVSHESVLAAYYRQTVATIETRRQGEFSGPQVGHRGGRFREVELGDGWPQDDGVPVADLGFHLPHGVVLVAVTRGESELAVRGDTGLRAGDRVLLYASESRQLTQAERTLREAKFNEEHASRGEFRELTLPAGVVERPALHDLDLPVGTLLVSIRRGQRTIVPSGATELRGGDVVTLFGASGAALDEAERALREGRRRNGTPH